MGDMKENGETHALTVTNSTTVSNTPYTDKGFFLCSTRWRFCLLLFVGNTLLYMHRVNLSLAVVCMVDITTADNHNQQKDTNGYIELQNATGNNSVYTYTNLTSANVSFELNTIGTDISFSKTITEEMEKEQRCGSVENAAKPGEQMYTPELDWAKSEISILVSSYFYGSFFTQIPSGRLSDRYGGKHIITASMIVTTIASLLSPIAARTSLYLMFAARIVIGLAGGAVIPAGISLISDWAPPKERSTIIAFTGCGFLFGAIISYLTSGLLCVYGFDNGWPSIFYIHGCLSFVFILFWNLEVYNSPSTHPRISCREREYIETSIKHKSDKAPSATPWKSIFTSRPFWASFVGHFANNWSFFTILMNVPLFMKEVLKFDVKQNGLYSALPFIFNIISALIAANVATTIIQKKIVGHLATRRLFTGINLLGFALCLVIVGHIPCEARYVAVGLLCLACFFGGCAFGGWLSNHTEYAGQFTGTVYGITNAGGVISSLLASMLAGLITPNGLQAEWQVVFYIAAGVDVIGAIVFITCSSVKLQEWALPRPSRLDQTLVVNGDAEEMKSLNQSNINESNDSNT